MEPGNVDYDSLKHLLSPKSNKLTVPAFGQTLRITKRFPPSQTMKTITRLTLFLFLVSSASQPVMAAMIETGTLLQTTTVSQNSPDQQVLRQLVSQLLVDRGVSAADAHLRAQSLSQAELQLIQKGIDDMPAGQGVVEVLGIVFIVLIILEILGVTNVFNRL